MTKLKKAAVILAVGFFAGIGAGFVIFEYVADMVQTAQEANSNGNV